MPGEPTPSEIQELRRAHYNATLTHMHKPQTDLAIFRVKPDYPMPDHRPGQYTTLGLGFWEPRFPGCAEENLKPGDETKLIRRAYSISHPILTEAGQLVPPTPPQSLEFYIVLVRSSDSDEAPALTPRLFMLRPGDRLFMGEKFAGHYTVESVAPTDTVLFLSTGTGEAPHNYLTWELLSRGHTGMIVAACCVRYRIDLGYLPLQTELMKRYPNYLYLPLTTREKDTIHHKVYIQDLIASGELEKRLGRPLDPRTTHVYLCGNPKMIGVPTVDAATGQKTYPQPSGVIEVLEQRGFRSDIHKIKLKGNIHFEEYW